MQNSAIQSIRTHSDLLLAWTSRIIRARYQQSVLGAFWAIIQPAAQVLVFTIIFTQFIRIQTGDTAYILFSSVGMVPWTFFAASLSDMVTSLTQNMQLVTKIYFPREILPLAALLARFVDFLIASVMLVILMLFFQTEVDPFVLLSLPLVLAIQMVLGLGLGLIGAALNVFYRDIQHIISLGLQVWMYASPIVYPIERVQNAPQIIQNLYFLNPMAGIISAYRSILLEKQFPDQTLLLSAGIAALALLFGYWFFKRVEFQFADVV
jgi:lipopolysaccharide transport system permease protein